MKTKGVFTIGLLLFLSTSAFSQGDSWKLFRGETKKGEVINLPDSASQIITERPRYDSIGVVIYHNDTAIDRLLNEYSENPPTLYGYRIQLFSGNNMEANKIYGNFIKQFQAIRAYKKWASPNYVVKVGDFKTKLDAYRFLNKIKGQFNDAFLVKDEIQKMKF